MSKYHQEPNDHKENTPSESKHLIIATYLLVIVSAILAFFTYMLWYQASTDSRASDKRAERTDSLAQKQFELAQSEFNESQRNTKKSLDISDSSVRVNEKYIKAFREASEKGNRAYIVVLVDSAGVNERHTGVIAVCHYENIGKTPASSVRHCASVALLPVNMDLPPDFFAQASDIANRQPPDVLGIGEKAGLYPTSNHVSQGAIDSVSNGKIIMYLYGVILYDDVFNRHHRTRYCMKFFPAYNAFGIASKYNDAQ